MADVRDAVTSNGADNGSAALGWRDRWLGAYARMPYHRGKGRAERLLRRIMGAEEVDAVSPTGVRYRLAPEEVVQREILVHGAYEPRTLALMQRLLRSGDTMVDVGGHVGQYALHAARAVGPTGRVVAFEPNPRTYRYLTRNVDLNGLRGRIVPVLAAVDTRVGVAPMFAGREENWGLASLGASGDVAFHVATVPLTEALRALGVQRLDVLKIDVEGYEGRVLRSLDLGSELRPRHIILEFIPAQLASCGENATALLDAMRAAGYRIAGVDGEPLSDPAQLPELNLWAADGRVG